MLNFIKLRARFTLFISSAFEIRFENDLKSKHILTCIGTNPRINRMLPKFLSVKLFFTHNLV